MKTLTIEAKWAILFSVMTLIWILLERISGLHSTHIAQHAIFTNVFIIPAVALYVIALREIKSKGFDGKMSFQQGLLSGLIMTLMITALTPVTQTIATKYISPNFFQNFTNYAVQSGQLSLKDAEQYFNLKSYIIQALIGTPVMGMVTTLIIVWIIRTKTVKA